MKKFVFLLGIFLTSGLVASQTTPGLIDGFRAPAVPLVVFDPYINIWSPSSNLYDSWPMLWDGTTKALAGAIRVDGVSYRFMGIQEGGLPAQSAQQISVQVLPTTTVYKFRAGGVDLTLKFITPNDPRDLQSFSEPVTYISFSTTSNDGNSHRVQLYFDQSGEITANDTEQMILWSRDNSKSNLVVLKMGKQNQTYFNPKGDGVGINWGYAYLAVPKDSSLQTVLTGAVGSRDQFSKTGNLVSKDDTRMPRKVSDDWPVMAVRFSMDVTSGNSVEKHIIYVYDDVYAMDYFGTPFEAYWKQNVPTISSLVSKAESNYAQKLSECKKLDTTILTKTSKAGGDHYSTIAALSWRQTLGAHKLVWNPQKKMPWLFLKEISSNGDFSTVDVLYPAIPLLLWANPNLAQLILLPHLSYAANEAPIKYGLEWAPHQLGTWPVADATPLGQEQMPVEETGNLLLIAEWLSSNNPSGSKIYTEKMYPAYARVLDGWAKYLTSGYKNVPSNGTIEKGIDRPGTDLPGTPVTLKAGSKAADCQKACILDKNCASWAFDDCGGRTCWMKGSNTAQQFGQNCKSSGYIPGKLILPDPGYQLCTDDFLGPIPHNVNLAAKGIIAVDGYATFLKQQGRPESEASFYSQAAKSFSTYWLKNGNDGGHYKLQYDKSGFSLQYNMIFQKFLKINTFPESVFESETDFYLQQANKYGTPLNNNAAADGRAFTKFDWFSWAGAMTSDSNKAARYWKMLYDYANETPSRVPLCDWYDTKTGAAVGFKARPVVGGFYAWMLLQKDNRL